MVLPEKLTSVEGIAGHWSNTHQYPMVSLHLDRSRALRDDAAWREGSP
jgi:hypothetical protein